MVQQTTSQIGAGFFPYQSNGSAASKKMPHQASECRVGSDSCAHFSNWQKLNISGDNEKILVIEDATNLRHLSRMPGGGRIRHHLCGKWSWGRPTSTATVAWFGDLRCDDARNGWFCVLTTPRPCDSDYSLHFYQGYKAELRQGMDLGADDYLIKPSTAEELLGAIAARLEKQAA